MTINLERNELDRQIHHKPLTWKSIFYTDKPNKIGCLIKYELIILNL